MARIDAIILAAGLSTRMGEQKLLLPFGETSLLDYFLDHFPYHLFHKTILVYHEKGVREIAENHPVECIYNPAPEQGQSLSLSLGLSVSRDSDAVLFTVADQPFLDEGVISKLIEHFMPQSPKIICPQEDGKNRNPVLFPHFCYDTLLSLKGDSGGKQILESYKGQVELVEFTDLLSFEDADTKEDYQRLLAEYMKKK